MVTPFDEFLSVDYKQVSALAKYLVANGNDAILVNGTTGESPTTTDSEKSQIIKTVKKAVDVPVMAGVGTNDTSHSIKLAKEARDAGADALLVVTPYYNRPTQHGIVEHVKAIAGVSDLPIVFYDIPGRTGVQVQESTLKELGKIDTVVGVKDATGAAAAVIRKIAITGLDWYCGDDGLNFSMLTSGAVGIISVVSHVAGNDFKAVGELIAKNDVKSALEIFKKNVPLIDEIMGGGQGAAQTKAALEIRGVLKNRHMRLPVTDSPAGECDKLRHLL
jgi:4-hydroxy-tetrahydrodipicolinate synthase